MYDTCHIERCKSIPGIPYMVRRLLESKKGGMYDTCHTWCASIPGIPYLVPDSEKGGMTAWQIDRDS